MTATTSLKLGPVALALCLLLLATAAPARAELYIVSKTADTNDGACDADCSLREAVMAANARVGADYVTIPAGVYVLTIAGAGEDACATGDLDVTDDVFIGGAGPSATIIDATGLGGRVLDVVATGALASVVALTVTGGNETTEHGGGMRAYEGELVISDVVVTGNSALYSGGGLDVTWGTLVVQEGSVVRGNTAADFGGGVRAGPHSGGLTVTDSTVSGNSAADGGGIANLGGPLDVTRSTIARNWCLASGGGLYLDNTVTTGVGIANSTIAGNVAGIQGGGLYLDPGGGVSLHSVTLADNHAGTQGDAIASGGPVTLTNTLVAGGCWVTGASTTSNGGNLESPGDTCGMTPAVDQVLVADPLLNGLVNSGGSTATMVPRVGSPALGGGNDTYCLAEDQRGFPRTGYLCETGAVERQVDDLLFGDGLESGTLSSWSASSP